MATYTAPSAILSKWLNAGGSPVVSPSRWNAMVASNFLIFAEHSHTGSAGDGISACSITPTSTEEAFDTDTFTGYFPIASAAWNRNSTLAPGTAVSTTSQNSVIQYDIYLRTGSFILSFVYGKNPQSGIITACIDGASVGSVDTYFVTTDGCIANIEFDYSGSSGSKILAFSVEDKNVSSTGYQAILGTISIASRQ